MEVTSDYFIIESKVAREMGWERWNYRIKKGIMYIYGDCDVSTEIAIKPKVSVKYDYEIVS